LTDAIEEPQAVRLGLRAQLLAEERTAKKQRLELIVLNNKRPKEEEQQ
jgi:hypothetical protein